MDTVIVTTEAGLEQALRKILPGILSGMPQQKEYSEPTDTREGFLTASEIEAKFSISRFTRIQWDKKGILKPSKFGRRVYYRESDIQELFNQHRKI